MVEINNKTRNKVDLKLIKKIVENFLKSKKSPLFNPKIKKKKGEPVVSIAFVGDAKMRYLNKVYRGKDRTTDVLAFSHRPFGKKDKSNFFGEIIIDYAQIKRQAKQYKNSVKKELILILVHGLLHLLGHEDETKKGKRLMDALAVKYINILNL